MIFKSFGDDGLGHKGWEIVFGEIDSMKSWEKCRRIEGINAGEVSCIEIFSIRNVILEVFHIELKNTNNFNNLVQTNFSFQWFIKLIGRLGFEWKILFYFDEAESTRIEVFFSVTLRGIFILEVFVKFLADKGVVAVQ